MGNAYKLRFSNGQYARIAFVTDQADPGLVRSLLGLRRGACALVLHVGAALASQDVIDELRPMFEMLVPFASQNQIVIVDGGTSSGMVGMMGEARLDKNGTFPLVGVTPADHVLYPGQHDWNADDSRVPLEPNHTHFVLVKGGSWGIESQVLVSLGHVLARRPVALLINGGEIVRKEALMHARLGTPLLVLAGSGRVADEIIDALKRGTSDNILRETLAIGKIRVCTPESLLQNLQEVFGLEA